MTIALDLSSACFRSLRLEGGTLRLRSLPAVYCAAECERHLLHTLKALGRSYVVTGDRAIVVGEAAVAVAAYLGSDCTHFAHGAAEGGAEFETALSAALDRLLVSAGDPGEACPLALPPSGDVAGLRSRMSASVCKAVALRTYQPLLVSSGLAVVLAGGKSSGFSGVGANFSTGGIDISVVRNGREIARTSIRRADAESGPLAPTEVDAIIAQAAVAVAHLAGEFREPVDFLCGGEALRGRTAPPLTDGHLKWHRFPLPIRGVRLVADPELAVVRGLLIHAELERRYRHQAA